MAITNLKPQDMDRDMVRWGNYHLRGDYFGGENFNCLSILLCYAAGRGDGRGRDKNFFASGLAAELLQLNYNHMIILLLYRFNFFLRGKSGKE